MTCYQKIICPNCGSDKIMKSGWNAPGTLALPLPKYSQNI